MIYILLLEKNKWYIGYTDRKDGERFYEHFTGKGAMWTQIYKPVQVMEWREGTMEDENKITLEYMRDYGWWNVRGGNYCSIDMERPPKELMPNLLPKNQNNPIFPKYNYGKGGNYFRKKDCCFRCGRNTHYATYCYAKTDINGYYLDD